MAVTDFQRSICRLIADHRKRTGVSYVAGGVALNLLLDGARLSRDIDIFHDAEEAVHSSFATDSQLLERAGFTVSTLRELPGFVAALVTKSGASVRMEWVRDSAFRFFPLMEHEQLGLTLHPFDLATNKILAMVGRLEVRDWVDAINADRQLQPLGYLLWAACGKEPGYSPGSLLAYARRTTHYSAVEVARSSNSRERRRMPARLPPIGTACWPRPLRSSICCHRSRLETAYWTPRTVCSRVAVVGCPARSHSVKSVSMRGRSAVPTRGS